MHNNKKLNKAVAWPLLGLVLASLLAVGSMDYEDAIASEQHYCEMVAGGYWPAYNNRIDCDEVTE